MLDSAAMLRMLFFISLLGYDVLPYLCFFFFNDTATTEIYTLSLHDALPISRVPVRGGGTLDPECRERIVLARDRKSTRLNSSHQIISYAVFCLKKKKRYTKSSK